MNKIEPYTFEETEALIAVVRLPCNADHLQKDLNVFIEHYLIINSTPSPNKKSKLKEIKNLRAECEEYYDKTIDTLKKATSSLYCEREKIVKFGVTRNKLNHAILTNLQAVDYFEAQKNIFLEILDKNQFHAEQNTYFSFKNVMLCSVLPNIYEANFKKPAGFSRSGLTGSATGPALRFIRAVSEKVRNEMNDEAIIKGYQRIHE